MSNSVISRSRTIGCSRCAVLYSAEKRDAAARTNAPFGRSAGSTSGACRVLHGHRSRPIATSSAVQRDRIGFLDGICCGGGRGRKLVSVSRLLQEGWAR